MLYDEFVKNVLNETLSIYGPDTIGHMEQFKEFLEDSILSSAIKGNKIAVTSASNMVTSNVQQALIGSGIKKDGLLPIGGKCYSTNVLDDNNMPNIVKMQLEAKTNSLVSKMKGKYGINKYIADNPNSDPNAYEIVDVLTTYNNLVASGQNIPDDIKADIDNMFLHRKKNFAQNGIGLDSTAYKICEFCYNPENSGNYPLPAVTIEAMKKLASLDLYSRQQIRDKGPLFDNVAEVETVKNYFAASNTINPGFLDQFKEDLENLYNVTKENKDKQKEDKLK